MRPMKRSNSIQLAFVILSGVTALGCGGGKSSTKATPVEEAVVGPPQVAWKDMKKNQKAKFMEKVVVPKMQPLFVAFDAKKFENFSCETCHGGGAEDGTYEMPNPDIEALPTTPEGFGKLMQDKPEWLKFMGGQVKPEMAKLLGIEEFDPKAPKEGAFGCYACHTTETAATTPAAPQN